MIHERTFLEAIARVPEQDFIVLGAGFVTVRLWARLSVDRLIPGHQEAIDAAMHAASLIPDQWRLARTALQEAIVAITTTGSNVIAQTALARYAGAIASLSPEMAAAVLARIRMSTDGFAVEGASLGASR